MNSVDVDQVLYGPDVPDSVYDDPPVASPGAAEANRDLARGLAYQKLLEAEEAAVTAYVAEVQDRWEERKAVLESRIGWHSARVEAWHRAAVAKGGPKSVHLPAGVARVRKGPRPQVQVTDEEALRAWLVSQEAEGGGSWEDLVYTAPSPKPSFKITELEKLVGKPKRGEPGSVLKPVTEDGEVVPGVQYFEPPPSFKISAE